MQKAHAGVLVVSHRGDDPPDPPGAATAANRVGLRLPGSGPGPPGAASAANRAGLAFPGPGPWTLRCGFRRKPGAGVALVLSALDPWYGFAGNDAGELPGRRLLGGRRRHCVPLGAPFPHVGRHRGSEGAPYDPKWT